MAGSYTFSSDWFSNRIPLFEKYLEHLRGQPCKVIEIGVFEGRSTVWLLENILTHPEARIICLDVVAQPPFWSNVEACGGKEKTQLLLGLSGENLRTLPLGEADFIYVDGSHNAPDVLEDSVLSFRLLKSGGILAFDDYYRGRSDAGTAIDAFLNAYKGLITVMFQKNQAWIRKLNEPPVPRRLSEISRTSPTCAV